MGFRFVPGIGHQMHNIQSLGPLRRPMSESIACLAAHHGVQHNHRGLHLCNAVLACVGASDGLLEEAHSRLDILSATACYCFCCTAPTLPFRISWVDRTTVRRPDTIRLPESRDALRTYGRHYADPQTVRGSFQYTVGNFRYSGAQRVRSKQRWLLCSPIHRATKRESKREERESAE